MSEPTRLWTAERLLDAGSRLEHCELWDGALLVREQAGGWAGPIGMGIGAPLYLHVRRTGSGWVADSSTGFFVKHNPDRVLSPAVSYVSKQRLPAFPRRGFVPVPPDFAVEVKSQADAWLGTIEKCGVWIAHGVQVVWAVNPDTREVVEFRPGETPREVGADGVASAEPAVDGFDLRVAELFAGLDAGGDASTGSPD